MFGIHVHIPIQLKLPNKIESSIKCSASDSNHHDYLCTLAFQNHIKPRLNSSHNQANLNAKVSRNAMSADVTGLLSCSSVNTHYVFKYVTELHFHAERTPSIDGVSVLPPQN